VAPLTPREKEVLALLVNGNFSNKDVARELRIGVRTAKFHMANLFQKFGVRRRGDLIVMAKSTFHGWSWPL
jgi:DNA-binding CsgD family transcriptional regulator